MTVCTCVCIGARRYRIGNQLQAPGLDLLDIGAPRTHALVLTRDVYAVHREAVCAACAAWCWPAGSGWQVGSGWLGWGAVGWGSSWLREAVGRATVGRGFGGAGGQVARERRS